ncbi:MAG: molybdate ABC transporter substrate-binding protein [Dehalococcoidia bacterium]|nr:molybdate ABC transporter substrate-binding protein [Dehalococcoidia bacterium]
MNLFKKAIPLFLLSAVMLVGSVGCAITVTDTITKTINTTDIPEVIPPSPFNINIAAAASLEKALREIDAVYSVINPHITFTESFAGSGALQTQIEQGLECDVFILAAATQMNNLQNGGYLLNDTRVNLLNNEIVLIVPKDSTLGLTSFNDLTNANVGTIALGQTVLVPAGDYAVEAFNQLGIYEDVMKKEITYGTSVTQVLQWVSTGNADAGVVYLSDALGDSNVTIVAYGPAAVNATIVYPAAILEQCDNVEEAQAYLDFLSSEPAILIFEKYGFKIAE